MNESTMISKCDKYGRITYISKKFEEVSGWKLSEVIGKNHKIFGSNSLPKSFWKDMFDITIEKKEIWNGIIKNINKNGEPYYLDTHIKAEFDKNGELIGFISIRQDITQMMKSRIELEKKNRYLEHAAKIIRHDMHSGINVYIPIGIKSLERRLNDDVIKKYKLETTIKLIKGGLKQTQNVYKSVYEFTNLIKKDTTLNKDLYNLKEILTNYLSTTAYKSQVLIDDSLPNLLVNESLFCTAIDNLIRNGLKYNDSNTKLVKSYYTKKNEIIVEDNGRGLSKDEFMIYSKPYMRKFEQKELGSGLGLNISLVILEEHGFNVDCEKTNNGTKIKIKTI
jgi:osomolarity two-component system, sensor histidine kinase NIK1